jgi:hypothetical protein
VISGGLQLPHDLGKDQLHFAFDHAAHILHHKYLRLESLKQADIFPE